MRQEMEELVTFSHNRSFIWIQKLEFSKSSMLGSIPPGVAILC